MAAAELDHIKPTSKGGKLMDPANVQPLCRAHHRAKTDTEVLGRMACNADGDPVIGWR